MSIRAWIAYQLRKYADRLDYAGAPKRTNYSFTFEDRRGFTVREDGRGCPLWYYGDADYERAHTEADTDHAIVNWQKATATFGRQRP